MNQTSLFTGAEAPPVEQFEAVWIKARVQGKALKVGLLCVFSPFQSINRSADMAQVSAIIGGQRVLYREQTTWFDFYSYKDKSIGCDRAAWDKAVEMGAAWMVTYAKKERRLCITHKSHFTYNLDLGRGIQARAKARYCRIYEAVEALPVPMTKRSLLVESQ